MSTALSASEYIYQGVWINWNRGAVLGSTLTVDPYHAAILSPALAVFISIAGSQLWRLFQFALHQLRATSEARDLLYHQQQTILRNTATDLNTLWRLGRVAVAWRHQRDAKAFKTSLPLIFWTLIHFTLIVLVGLFSSWLLETNNEVLSRSPWCGTTNKTYLTEVYATDNADVAAVRLAMEYGTYINSRYAAVQQHVDICQTSVEGCDSLPVRNLTWSSHTVANGCPFAQSVCHPDIGGSIAFDTGYLSSSAALGFNARAQDRISFRMTAECAPLNDAKYATGWQDVSDTSGSRQIADVKYGPSATNSRNATYSVARQNLECDQQAITPVFALNSEFTAPGGNVSASTATFDAIEELRVAEADVSLTMLSGINAYEAPVHDPWFSAQQAFNETNAFCLELNGTFYTREQPLTTIGCTQQWQICDADISGQPQTNQCTPALALSQIQALLATHSTPGISLSPRQLATASRMINAATRSSFFYLITALSQSSSPPLKARNLVSNTIGLPLPDGQWQIETKYWLEILLAYFQQTSLDYSTGQFAANTAYINVTKPSSTDAHENALYWLCQNQIIRSSVYRNFNFFALLFTVILCTIIIVLGLVIEDVIGYTRQRSLTYSGVDGKQDMWIANSDLEMLRTIDEAKNGSIWSRSKNGVPLTHKGYHVSINDLRSENVHVQEGVGIVNMAVKRQQTALEELRSNRRPYGWNHPGKHERCATCSTFEQAPSESLSVSASAAAGMEIEKNDSGTETALKHQMEFSRDSGGESPRSASSKALPQGDKLQQQQTRRSKKFLHIANTSTSLAAHTRPVKMPQSFANPYADDMPSGEDAKSSRVQIECPCESGEHQSYNYPISFSSNRRTQDLERVYEQSLLDPAGRSMQTERLPSGWGVLPKRMSQIWKDPRWQRDSSGYVQ